MKKTILIAIILLVVLIVIGFFGFVINKQKFPPVAKKENTFNCAFRLDNDEIYNIVLGKFDTPYIPSYQRPFKDVDFSNIMQVIDAQHSAKAYGWDNYLLIMENESKNEVEKVNNDTSGTYAKSLNDNLGKFRQDDYPVIYTHWVGFEKDGNTHRLMVGKFSKEEDRQKFTGTFPVLELIKQNEKWLITTIDTLPFTADSYENMMNKCTNRGIE